MEVLEGTYTGASQHVSIHVERDLYLDASRVVRNPDDKWFIEYLRPYYVQTADGQYLFANLQLGRRPDEVAYMVPKTYRLGKGQRSFDSAIGLPLYDIVRRYLKTCRVIVQEGVQGESGYKTGLRIVTSIENPHTAYMPWFGRQMIHPPEPKMDIQCWNYIVQERLPDSLIAEIRQFWSQFDPDAPLTLYDFTEMDKDRRRVMSLRVDYFGGAYKKPNLTMVWNRGESDGFVSYHAGCTADRILKGLSGTGKTTLSVGPELEQDDACLGLFKLGAKGRIEQVQLIGLEAASYAKSEGLVPTSPEWAGLMKSREVRPDGTRPIVLCHNIDCEGIEYRIEEIKGYKVKVPRPIPGQPVGHLQCTRYEKSGTTNGRFVFRFDALNPRWHPGLLKWLHTEMLSFRRFDIFPLAVRVTDPAMAVALDAGCESVITSAVGGKVPGTRVRSYAATDFMAREESHQALTKLKMYSDLDLGPDGKLVFAVVNTGYIGEYDLAGNQRLLLDERGQPVGKIDEATGNPYLDDKGKPVYRGLGEKITVSDTKRLVDLIEHRKIQHWLSHPVFGAGYLVPDPAELEKAHGIPECRRRFNPLRFYSAEEYLGFCERDIRDRTAYLHNLFSGQQGEDKLQSVVQVWERCRLPSAETIERFYKQHFGAPHETRRKDLV
jgi:hypothetical protein